MPTADDSITEAEIRDVVDRVLGSTAFAKTRRLSEFLHDVSGR